MHGDNNSVSLLSLVLNINNIKSLDIIHGDNDSVGLWSLVMNRNNIKILGYITL